jgi:hypothetical protein
MQNNILQFFKGYSRLAFLLLPLLASLLGCTKENLEPDKVEGIWTYSSIRAVELTRTGADLIYDTTLPVNGILKMRVNQPRDNRGGTEYGQYQGTFTTTVDFVTSTIFGPPRIVTGFNGPTYKFFKASYRAKGDEKKRFNSRDLYSGSALVFPAGIDSTSSKYSLPGLQIKLLDKKTLHFKLLFGRDDDPSFTYTRSFI